LNGVHDMGGMHGFGPVVPEAEGPPFHAEWESRIHAMTVAAPTRANIDAGRHERELIPPAEYLAMSYYQRWFRSLSELLLKQGLVTPGELATGRADPAGPRHTPRLPAERVAGVLTARGSYVREGAPAAVFAVGDRVRARNLNPDGHTRLPRYVRGRKGTVERLHGAHVLPDAHAHGLGEAPRLLYGVRFSAQELWGADAPSRDSVCLDLWEPYLEHA
jgi:nitrile hydratase